MAYVVEVIPHKIQWPCLSYIANAAADLAMQGGMSSAIALLTSFSRIFNNKNIQGNIQA